ncbi:hypothetical protein TNCT_381211 [Trichonephila clavata]|uniref:Uncharacterized protein n=1 Tax=Trichonephila clavata TaxID=2740835 RepID=A0A8X6L9A3_TRICU|nr:hypothetical protein TNCT_381211 [Trichonephila clavata]
MMKEHVIPPGTMNPDRRIKEFCYLMFVFRFWCRRYISLYRLQCNMSLHRCCLDSKDIQIVLPPRSPVFNPIEMPSNPTESDALG